MTCKRSNSIFDALGDREEACSGLDELLLGVVADLSMDLSGLAVICEKARVPET